MKILTAATMKGAVNYHRLISPHIALKERYPETEILSVVDQRSILNTNLFDVDIIIFTRCIFFEDLDLIVDALKRKFGCKVVLDIDDYWILDDHHILKEQYTQEYVDQVIKSVKAVDWVITTNKRLKKKVRPYNKRVEIIPNYINTGELQWKPSPRKAKNIKYGYVGGQTHLEDLQFTKTDFSLLDATAYVDGYKDLGFKISEPKDEWSYGHLFDSFDVSLAPLLPTPFNGCKSNLKVVEAGAKGKAICATRTPPYTDFESENIIWFDPNESWENKLILLAKEKAHLKDSAKLLHEEVLDKYSVDYWTEYRMKFYIYILG